jgi:hyperosmotically inducible periplasmic protein
MKRFLLLSLLLCLSLQVACNRGTTSEAAREQRGTLTDSDLKNEIIAKLNSTPELRDAISVDADADHNVVTLSGTVESETMRSRAVQLAKSAHPRLVVEDKIDVRPRELTRSDYTEEQARQEVQKAKARNETVGDSVDDAWIHAKIVGKLITDLTTPERKINVDVNHNMVTLRGTVENATQKQEAERIARETDGVKGVNNLLKISKS